MSPEEHKEKCEKCEYSRKIGRFGRKVFLGCYHSPYKGKWVVEIDKCPKEVRV